MSQANDPAGNAAAPAPGKGRGRVITLVAILLVALCLVFGEQFWLKPSVEESVRMVLTQMQGPDGKPMDVSLGQPEFSLLSRTVTVPNLAVRSNSQQGPVTTTIDTLVLKLPVRAILACTELTEMFLPDKGPMLVADSIETRNLTVHSPQGRTTVQKQTTEELTIDAAVLRRMLASPDKPDTIAITYACGAKRAEGVFCNLHAEAPGTKLDLDVKKFSFAGWKGREVTSARSEGIALRVNGTQTASLGAGTLKALTLPAEEDMRAIASEASSPAPDMKKLEAVFTSIFDKGDVRVGECGLESLVVPLGSGQTVSAKTAAFRCESLKTPTWGLDVKGLSVPGPVLARELEIALPGLKELKADLAADMKTDADGKANVKAAFSADDLCEARASLSATAGAPGADLLTSLASRSYGDIALSYADRGLLARASLLVGGDGELERSADQGARQIFARGQEQDGKALSAVLAFIEKPGSLSVKTRPGVMLSAANLLQVASGQAADLFDVSSVPGAETLATQKARLAGR